jgi:parvulin-like peptidyl-prolyl isomerase
MPRKVVSPQPTLTRKQHIHLRRDEIQTRWVMAGLAVVLLVVIGIVGFGYVRSFILRMNEPVAVVFGEKITVNQWQKEVRYRRMQYIDRYGQYAALANIETNTSYAKIYQDMAVQYQQILQNPSAIGEEALTFMVDGAVVRHEALARNLAVTDGELQEKIEQLFQYTPAPTLTVLALTPPTPTSTATITPTPDPLTPTATPTASATPTVSGTPTAVLLPTLAPNTPTPYMEEAFRTNYSQFLSKLQKSTGMTETDFRERLRVEMLTAKLKSAIVADVPHEQEQYHLARIVVADATLAEVARTRITGGEDWATVVKEVSTDTLSIDKGGDIGWIGPGLLPADAEKEVFALAVGEISQPIQTDTAEWSIYRLQEKGVRTLEDYAYTAAQEAFYRQWLSSAKSAEGAVEIVGFASDVVPTDPALSAN